MADERTPFLGSVMKHIACTPNKNFDDLAYDKGVIEPANNIRNLQRELADRPPSNEQIKQVIEWLVTIFETKMVDAAEQEERLRELFDRYDLHQLFPDRSPLDKA